MKQTLFFIFLLSSIITLVGCNGCNNSKDKNCSSNITFQLNWTNDPTFTGEYIAYEKFWATQKLNVTVKQGGIGVDPIAMVVSKTADYAVVGADRALIAIANGSPIKIISVDFQRNPVGWIARQNLKVNSFDDLDNRTDLIIGDKAGSEVSSILSLIIKRKKLNIKPQSVSYDFPYFIANEKAVYPVYLNEEPVRARVLNKIDVVEIDPSNEENGGISLYGNVIITHADKFDSCKSQIDAVVEGLSKGWAYAKQNSEDALKIVNKYVQQDEQYVREVINRTVNFVTIFKGSTVPPGHMEITAWESTYNTLKEANLISNNIDLKKVLYIK